MNLPVHLPNNTMKNIAIITKFLSTAAMVATVATLVSACSDDKPKAPAASAPVTTQEAIKKDHNPNPWDHSGETPVTENQKHKFEQQFADQCVKRETEHAGEGADSSQFNKPCACIAQYMAKNLTPQEAEKFLDEHENPHSLEIKYENAAFHCLQQQQPPHDPDFSRKQ